MDVRPRVYRLAALAGALVLAGLPTGLTATQGSDAEAPDAMREPATPERYVLDYPPAQRFCPPVQTFFYEVVRTFEVVRGRRFTHQPNGGYGLPIVQKVDGKHLLHLGADVGWHRVGAPVYAVAAGVVRVSEGPSLASDNGKTGAGGRRSGPRRKGRPKMMLHWGNQIIIEHRLPSGEHFATVYGHLGSNRFVKAGDIVVAGQQIGTIGRKHFRINGGYDPHVHFAVRQGRLAEPGCTLLELYIAGTLQPMKLVELGDEEIQVELPEGFPASLINLGGDVYPFTRRDGKLFLPARLLWQIRSRPGFQIVGYGLSTDGWHDPVAFLRQHGADRNPAPFRGPKKEPADKKGK